MVKLRFLLLVTLLAVTLTQLNVAWRIVSDRRSLAAVSANMACLLYTSNGEKRPAP